MDFNLIKSIAMIVVALIAVPTFILSYYEYKKQGKQKRVDLYLDMEERLYENDEFRQALEESGDRVLVAGIESHVCINQTVSDLLANEYLVHVVEDAVSDHTRMGHKRTMRNLEAQGARITGTEALMYELARTSERPEFKRLLGYIMQRRAETAQDSLRKYLVPVTAAAASVLLTLGGTHLLRDSPEQPTWDSTSKGQFVSDGKLYVDLDHCLTPVAKLSR